MADGTSLLQTTAPAAIGILGVIVGALATTWRERSAEKRKARKDSALVAAVIGGELDRFIAGCIAVSQDDGEPDHLTGIWDQTANTPTFDPSKYQVEWRSIDEKIMFDIHDLPYEISYSDATISAAGEHDSPPDYSDWFEERQYQYAKLGLHCLDIVQRLRASAKLTPRRKTHEWDPRQAFQDKIEAIDARRAKAKQEDPFAA